MKKNSNIEILMIGPGESKISGGGVVMVIDSLTDELNHNFVVTSIVTMRPVGIVKRLNIYLQSLFLIFKSLANNNKKIAHIHMTSRFSFYRKSLIIIVLKIFHIPILIHLHGAKFHLFYESLSPVMKRYLKWIYSLADKTILLSRSWQKWFQKTINTSDSMVLYNGVKSYLRDSALPLNQRDNVVLFLGRLGERKGIYDLLNAFKEVVRYVPDAVLKIGGDGAVEECKKLVIDLDIEKNVEFFGWIGEEQKYQLINESKIYILPSYNEGMPMGILEAMSAGITVIASDVGGIPEAIENNTNGVLIKAGDKKQISDSIVGILQDSKKATQLGIQARKSYLDNFNITDITKKIKKEYYEYIK